MRCAVLGPTPGRVRNASISCVSRAECFKGDAEAGRQNGSFIPGGSCRPAVNDAIFS
jgi:hypothetical protein